MTISKRKSEHIKICLEKKVELGSTRFNEVNFKDIDLIHSALPDVNLKDIDVSCSFLGKELKAPLIISGMTGGTHEAEKINKNLAKAAQECGIAMGVGSQRAAIEDSSLEKTYQVREVAPDILLIANLGIIQFIEEYTIREAEKAIDMIDADALALHLNPLQEICQSEEGNVNWKNCLKKIEEICRILDKPVIAKEVGAGISKEIGIALEKAGVSAIDISGLGGTSWSLVEMYRNPDSIKSLIDWGIPTAISLIEVVSNVKIPVIASGGIRNGKEIAKSLALGAEIVGIALPFLEPATKNSDKVKEKINSLVKELKAVMFLVGAENLKELKRKPIVITGKTKEWLEARGIDVKAFALR